MIYSSSGARLYKRKRCRWRLRRQPLLSGSLHPRSPFISFSTCTNEMSLTTGNECTRGAFRITRRLSLAFEAPGAAELPIGLLLKDTKLVWTDPDINCGTRIHMKAELFSWNMKIGNESRLPWVSRWGRSRERTDPEQVHTLGLAHS